MRQQSNCFPVSFISGRIVRRFALVCLATYIRAVFREPRTFSFRFNFRVRHPVFLWALLVLLCPPCPRAQMGRCAVTGEASASVGGAIHLVLQGRHYVGRGHGSTCQGPNHDFVTILLPFFTLCD